VTRALAKTPRIAILGAGLSGMCMGIQLLRAGIRSFRIFEKADRVGGTWRDNSYPGVACDVPSHLYSYSFELNPDWSRVYSPGPEIQSYCEQVAEKYGLGEHLRFATEVVEARFQNGCWKLRDANGGEYEADIMVSALGGLHRPHVPEFAGLSDFEGETFHSARWNHAHNLTGRTVAVIGSAASAIQLVPEIAPLVKKLYVFQRTPNWITPRMDQTYSAKVRERFRRHPWTARLHRWLIYWLLEMRFPVFKTGSRFSRFARQACLDHLAEQVPDPELRQKLTPDYPPGCKRMLISSDFYPALQRPNVELVTEGVTGFTKQGVTTGAGRALEVDTVIFATGFEPFEFHSAFDVTGPKGVRLADVWKSRIYSHRTVAVPGFPNFFMLLGPNSGLGHNSVIIMIEAQVRYVLRFVQQMMKRGLHSLAARETAMQSFDSRLHDDMAKTIWFGNCKSWYQDEQGRVFTLWPRTTLRYLWEMRKPRLDEYEQLPD